MSVVDYDRPVMVNEMIANLSVNWLLSLDQLYVFWSVKTKIGKGHGICVFLMDSDH